MPKPQRVWIAVSLAVIGATTGCSTTSSFSMWPSGWFGGSKSTPPSSPLSQSPRNVPPVKPSMQGANAQLGAAPSQPNTFSSMTASFKKWTGGEETAADAPPPDPLSLDTRPKQISPELYVQMARMHEAKGDFAGAVKQYEQALKVSPNSTDILVGMARAYDRSGNIQQAIATYQQAIKVDSKCALAYNDLGLCYARQKDLARSRENLQRAVTLVPTSKLYRNNYATVLAEAQQYNEALEQLSAVHPPAIAQYNLGVLANRSGNKSEALRRFQQAAATDPNLAAAQKMIDKLNGVAAQPSPQSSPATSLQDQAKQMQAQWQMQARQAQSQLQTEAQQMATGWQEQAKQLQTETQSQARLQVEQVKTQLNQAETQFASQVQTQANDAQAKLNAGVTKTSESAQSAIRDAEAKIRAALQSQTAPIAPSYGSSFMPADNDDITPIEEEPTEKAAPPAASTTLPLAAPTAPSGASKYSISDDAGSDSVPVLLPPTNE